MIQSIQLRHLFKVISGSTPESGKGYYWDGDIPWVTPEDLSSLENTNVIYDTRRKITEEGYDDTGLNIAPKNSIVLTKRAPIGLLAILGVEACSNQGCFLLTPNENILSRFYYYYLFSCRSYLHVLGRGSTFMELNSDDVKSLKIPLLSLQRQIEIANYLDDEVGRVDNLIKQKESLLQLLAEKKQAIITHAVTKGINPNTKMKDSGIDWLGEIPEHWEVKKMSRVFNNISSGTTPKSTEKKYYEEGDISWIVTGDLNDGRLIETSNKITQYALDDYTTLKIYPINSLCIAMYGATIGKTAITGIEACTNQACCVLYYSDVAKVEFIQLWFIARRNDIVNLANGGGQPNISQGIIKDLRIALPSIDEQNNILLYLNAEIQKIDSLIDITEKSINLIRERRSALITAAVTGQIEIPSQIHENKKPNSYKS